MEAAMKIWVDADACPVVIKDILFKAAQRTGVLTTLVANQSIRIPPSEHIKMLVVPPGFDVADNEIVKLASADDLVITADIPLAAEVIEKGALALSPRGELFTASDIKAKLIMRDFMDTMRASGEHTGGQAPFSQRERQAFANQLDRWLAQLAKKT
jgi:hypothetical protein